MKKFVNNLINIVLDEDVLLPTLSLLFVFLLIINSRWALRVWLWPTILWWFIVVTPDQQPGEAPHPLSSLIHHQMTEVEPSPLLYLIYTSNLTKIHFCIFNNWWSSSGCSMNCFNRWAQKQHKPLSHIIWVPQTKYTHTAIKIYTSPQ